jgi:hypothetical protein
MNTKNQQNSLNNLVIIILALALVGLGGYVLFYKNSSDSQSQNDRTLTSTTTQTPRAETQALSQSPQSKCDTVAKGYFDTYKPYGPGFIETVNLSYQNHYSQTNESCYVLVSNNFNMKDNSDGSSSLKITYTLIDVFKKDPKGNYSTIGSYSQSISAIDKNKNRLDSCNVAGSDCSSLNGFMSSVNPYLGK